MKKTAILLTLALLLVLVSGCSSSLTGKWQKADGSVTLEFAAGGKASLTSELGTTEMTYSTKGNTLILKNEGMESLLTYSVSGDTLTTTDANDRVNTYTRVD